MQKAIITAETYNHLIYLPKEYHFGRNWPVILYLHGIGAKGDYLEKLKAHGLPKLLDEREDFPFIVISPQCPENQEWSPALLGMLLDDVAVQYPVDKDRIYLTGIGEGAAASWEWAAIEPERFAAVAPVCGRGNPHSVCKLRDVPVWAFHGARDKIVPISETQGMVLALKLCGGNVTFTVYPDAGHDSWTETYDNPQLYEWFLGQSRANFSEPGFDPVVEDID